MGFFFFLLKGMSLSHAAKMPWLKYFSPNTPIDLAPFLTLSSSVISVNRLQSTALARHVINEMAYTANHKSV